uniref:Coiled-coil_56 domain-containing protein n=1 Tax=Mesocestoides corti TaxID=53468 RepID=A0A5K3EZG7_MESCO
MSKDLSNDNIIRHFVKHTEDSNLRRATLFKARKNKSLFVAFCAAAFAVGSYLFSLNAVRQGRYLDESFDKLPESTKNQK